MLASLRIKNLALAADLTVELAPGFNAITGETGAGKSILIGALNLVLGERADRTLIRAGSDSCTVEAVFDVARLEAPLGNVLADNGLEPCEDHQLLVKRIFTAAGANRQFVNGTATTLNVLGTLGQWLVDIHGPHDHQSLFQPAKQLELLDAYGKLDGLRKAFGERVRRRIGLEAQKSALITDERTYAQQLDLLRFQVAEITTARLRADEDVELETEHRRAHNAARLLEQGQMAIGLLSEDDAAVLAQAGALGKILHELERLDPGASELLRRQEEAVGALAELQGELTRYLDRIEVNPQRLQELEDRLNLVQSLKRKYGSTLAAVIDFGKDAQEKLALLERREEELARLQAEMRTLEAEIWGAGNELSTQRRKVIPSLCKAAAKQLADLGFKQSSFQITLTSMAPAESKGSFSPDGLDTIEFQFAPNVGEPARPLRAIASSGEMARVMLALKTVLAAEDSIPVLVFDEVDANVGGETARMVGEKMRQIGRQRQVLCVTHLAPVAACAATHFLVTKQVKAGRTISTIDRLDKSDRVEELTRMLGGQSEAARRHAETLLEETR